MTTLVTLDKRAIPVLLHKLARRSDGESQVLYARVMSCWGLRPDRQRTSIRLNKAEMQLVRGLKLPVGLIDPGVVESRWVAVYRHPRKKTLEVKTHTREKPLKRRTFVIRGKKVRLVAVQITRAVNEGKSTKEAVSMARAKKKVVEEDELDELEGLEDLDDLEDEDLEDEEPEDEEEDEDEEEEEPAPKRTRSRKTPAKKAPAKTTRKRKVVDEDEEDDDEEEEEPAPKRRTAKKAPAKATAKKPAAKKSNGSNLPATRELPAGKLGPQDIADLVGGECDARYVRIFLRNNDYERPEGGRWAFGKQEARSIAKEIKAARRS